MIWHFSHPSWKTLSNLRASWLSCLIGVAFDCFSSSSCGWVLQLSGWQFTIQFTVLLHPCFCLFLLAGCDVYMSNWCDHNSLGFLEHWKATIEVSPGVRMVNHLWPDSTSVMRSAGTASCCWPARFIRVWFPMATTLTRCAVRYKPASLPGNSNRKIIRHRSCIQLHFVDSLLVLPWQ